MRLKHFVTVLGIVRSQGFQNGFENTRRARPVHFNPAQLLVCFAAPRLIWSRTNASISVGMRHSSGAIAASCRTRASRRTGRLLSILA